uniref:Uncharacterized protein n=1 Tax=Anguilla anguilla TaxID=7936 RepID=A0A0E9UEM0_ANGAN
MHVFSRILIRSYSFPVSENFHLLILFTPYFLCIFVYLQNDCIIYLHCHLLKSTYFLI